MRNKHLRSLEPSGDVQGARGHAKRGVAKPLTDLCYCVTRPVAATHEVICHRRALQDGGFPVGPFNISLGGDVRRRRRVTAARVSLLACSSEKKGEVTKAKKGRSRMKLMAPVSKRWIISFNSTQVDSDSLDGLPESKRCWMGNFMEFQYIEPQSKLHSTSDFRKTSLIFMFVYSNSCIWKYLTWDFHLVSVI